MRRAEAVLRAAAAAAALAFWVSLSHGAVAPRVFFDDFEHADRAALLAAGWRLREAAGHPGVPGARWSPEAVQLARRDGLGVLRLTAQTDGTPAGTVQAQACHQRKLLWGTYAARVRFSDTPASGLDGDPVVQTAYAVAPLRFDFDPDFSELDWEYLPNGGWGSPATRLYAVAWQTARLEPWSAHNTATETVGSLDGWHTLVVQVEPAAPAGGGRSRWFVDGREVAVHGGRQHPAVPMMLSLNHWFSPTGLLPPTAAPRVWVQDVDWVLHLADAVLPPASVERLVAQQRRAGLPFVDQIPLPQPPLPGDCAF